MVLYVDMEFFCSFNATVNAKIFKPVNQKRHLQSIKPKNYTIPNTKLSNEITKEFVNVGKIPLIVMKNNKGVVKTMNSLRYEDENKIQIKGEFSPYDRTVHNAVCALHAAGNEVFTASMIYRTLTGSVEREYVSQTALNDITESIDKSRRMFLKIDFVDEARARKLDIDKVTFESYLLPAKKITVVTGGYEKVEAWKLLDIPPLYAYAVLTKQIILTPVPLLDLNDIVNNTKELIPVKAYLLQRIEIMKNDRNQMKSRCIVYDTIFKESGIEIKHATQRQRLRKYISSILAMWRDEHSYIKNFAEYKEGRTIKGIEIKL